MDEEIITRVHVLAEKEGSFKVINIFYFEWRPRTTIKEPHPTGTSEDPSPVSKPTKESVDPDLDEGHTQQVEERVEEDMLSTEEEEDEEEEPLELTQPTEEVLAPHEDA